MFSLAGKFLQLASKGRLMEFLPEDCQALYLHPVSKHLDESSKLLWPSGLHFCSVSSPQWLDTRMSHPKKRSRYSQSILTLFPRLPSSASLKETVLKGVLGNQFQHFMSLYNRYLLSICRINIIFLQILYNPPQISCHSITFIHHMHSLNIICSIFGGIHTSFPQCLLLFPYPCTYVHTCTRVFTHTHTHMHAQRSEKRVFLKFAPMVPSRNNVLIFQGQMERELFREAILRDVPPPFPLTV